MNEDKPPVQGQGVNTHGPGIERHLAQMIAFASLDSVDELLEGTGNLYVFSPRTLGFYVVPAGLRVQVK